VVPELLSPGAHLGFSAAASDALPTDGASTMGSGIGSITELYGLDTTLSGSSLNLLGVADLLGASDLLGVSDDKSSSILLKIVK
jgi:hypothetical protein